ncbi:MAG: sugar ABC transporter ATP-binding protein, partial [Actinobacteria bacterium]|nr:sugar ABC transporter ATP-binding protein [Actinomycetota bacterium]
MDFLYLKQVSKSYDGTQALRKVDFSANTGEVHAIVGENGAGKTTLVKIIAGALERDEGEISLNGSTVKLGTPFSARRLGIRAVYQEFSMISHITVAENILIGQMPTRRLKWWVNWNLAYRKAEEILNGIGFTGINVRTTLSRLSVSQQQMVEIAKAVAEKPRILILDEPSAVLTRQELKRLFGLIQMLKEQSTLILYISHRLDEIFEVADRITVLKDGQLVGTVRSKEVNENQLIKMMVGRDLKEIYPHRRLKPDEEIFSVRGLSQEDSFSNISFSLARGEILGLFGLVGSGRTQVARCIFGAEQPTSGEIWLEGKVVKPKSPHAAVKAGISLLTEDRKRDGLVMSCSIRDNISLATMKHMSHLGFLNRRLQGNQVRSKVQELNINPPQIERLVRTLSGGNQQKVVLAKWLLSQTKVLILD